LRIGIGETLSLSLLAKTKNQNWRIVTKSNYYDGMEPVIIKTNELVVTYCGITNGSIDADFKYILVIGDSMIESNIFSGRINKKIID